jgi:hypothetical protein
MLPRKGQVSDSSITERVTQLLSNRGLRSPCRVSVTTLNGEVRLSGTVQHTHQKTSAVQAARGANGVRRVVDQLTVKPTAKQEAPPPSPTLETFRVWTRALGSCCRLRVEGLANTRWLIARLAKSFAVEDQPVEEACTACCTFEVPYGPQLSRSQLDRLLAAIPEVQIMQDPA